MSQTIETALAFILFLPASCILSVLYCLFPSSPRGSARLLTDLAVVLVAAALSIFAMRWGFHTATAVAGQLWRQIVATLLAYGVFLAVLCCAVPLRALWFRRARR